MVRPELDWKNQPRHIFDWFAILVAVLLIATYLSLWWLDGRSPYLVMAMVFSAWLAVYFTAYWQPILYLIMAAIVVGIPILYLPAQAFDGPIGLSAILLTVIFLLVIGYLLISEESRDPQVKNN